MTKEYEIKNAQWRAVINPNFGANIVRLFYEGQFVYNPLCDEDKLNENPFIYGSPILLPANRTANGKFIFESTEYTLPVTEKNSNANLHGFLYKQKFNITDYNDHSIALKFKNKGEIYPFPFEIKVMYSANGGSFCQRYEIVNTGKTTMPFTFALHTTFVEPEKFSVPIISEQERNEFYIPTGKFTPLNNRQQKYATGSQSRGIEISGYYKSNGNTARIGNLYYRVSDNFDHWVLYNGKGTTNLLCIEPQCGMVNGLNIKNGYRILKPKEKAIFTTELFPINNQQKTGM